MKRALQLSRQSGEALGGSSGSHARLLRPFVALGLAVAMGLAVPVHFAEGEPGRALVPLALGALAAFVAWGRHARAPIAPRPALDHGGRPA